MWVGLLRTRSLALFVPPKEPVEMPINVVSPFGAVVDLPRAG